MIERKTDVLAATAFLLALIGAAFQAAAFLRGAEVSLYPPEDVVCLFDTYPTGESVFRIAASMSYTNSGAAGHDAVVQRETVSFMLGDEPREQAWQSFQNCSGAVTYSQLSTQKSPARCRSSLAAVKAIPPLLLRAGGAVRRRIPTVLRTKISSTTVSFYVKSSIKRHSCLTSRPTCLADPSRCGNPAPSISTTDSSWRSWPIDGTPRHAGRRENALPESAGGLLRRLRR